MYLLGMHESAHRIFDPSMQQRSLLHPWTSFQVIRSPNFHKILNKSSDLKYSWISIKSNNDEINKIWIKSRVISRILRVQREVTSS